jgi:hypothetical protein
MTSKLTQVLAVGASLAALIAVVGWLHVSEALHDARTHLTASTLEPIAALLNEDQAILAELQSEPFAEQDSGILRSYLIKVRRDGVAKTAPMKQRLDQLAENNTALVTLITAYSQRATTPAFMQEASKFRTYAVAWRDRWNSTMELFMAGGDFPAASVPYPVGFLAAVRGELAANR